MAASSARTSSSASLSWSTASPACWRAGRCCPSSTSSTTAPQTGSQKGGPLGVGNAATHSPWEGPERAAASRSACGTAPATGCGTATCMETRPRLRPHSIAPSADRPATSTARTCRGSSPEPAPLAVPWAPAPAFRRACTGPMAARFGAVLAACFTVCAWRTKRSASSERASSHCPPTDLSLTSH